MQLIFTLYIPPVTKKNSSQIFVNKASGKPFITPSKKYKEYENKALRDLKRIKKQMAKPIDIPINLKCVFYMPTKRRVDLVNLLEAIQDVLVKAEILADDNCKIVVSTDGSKVGYDKENPRTEVIIDAIRGSGK